MKIHKSQCDSCAFKISESQASLADNLAIDKKYEILRNLKKSPKKLRAVSVSIGTIKTDETDKTETCFINSPLWPSRAKKIYCPDRLDNCLSLEAALSLRSASNANRIASDAALWAKWAVLIAIIAAIIAAKEQIIATILLVIGINP